MKKAIYIMTILLMTGLLAGCENGEAESNTESEYSQSEETSGSDNSEADDIELKDMVEIDFTYDYTEDIKADVNYVVSASSSLQEENGSMYPMLVNTLWEENTKNRAYFIANELAKIGKAKMRQSFLSIGRTE